MSGYYLLVDITSDERDEAQTALVGTVWSALQHADVGWNATSRGVLQTALQGGNIGNRNGLPPHRYLQIPAAPGGVLGEPERAYLRGAAWVQRLVRPNANGLGLRTLTAAAAAQWNANPPQKAESLILQIQQGAVSIEIYKFDGMEMT